MSKPIKKGQAWPVADPKSDLGVVLSALRSVGSTYGGALAGGRGGCFSCPLHLDEHPSLEITVGRQASVLANCKPCEASGDFADSSSFFAALLDRLGLERSDLPGVRVELDQVRWGPRAFTLKGQRKKRDKKSRRKGVWRRGPAYVYRNADGQELYRVEKFELFDPKNSTTRLDKTFRMVPPDGRDMHGVERVPYRFEESANWGTEVLAITEGEKDADRLRETGAWATTFAGGHLHDGAVDQLLKAGVSKVCLYGDLDDAGFRIVRRRAAQLGASGIVVHTRFPDPGELAKALRRNGRGKPEERVALKCDVSDWIDAGFAPDQMVSLKKAERRLARLRAAAKVRDRRDLQSGANSSDRAAAVAEGLDPVVAALLDRCPVLDIEALLDPQRPPRPWFIEGIVPRGDQVALVAPGGTGKSLLVLGLCLEAVRGRDVFLGRSLRFTGKVAYFDFENTEEDWVERLRSFGVDQEEARSILRGRFLPFSMPSLAGLDTAAGARQLFAILDAHNIGVGDLVVLDSTQRIVEGEENSNDTIRDLYHHTSSELRRRGITVIRTDNTGWDRSRVRGASAKQDDVGYVWDLRRTRPGHYRLTNAKHRGRENGLAGPIDFVVREDGGALQFQAIEPSQRQWDPVRGDADTGSAFKQAATLVARREFERGRAEGSAGTLTQREMLARIRSEKVAFKDSHGTRWLGELAGEGCLKRTGGEMVATATGNERRSTLYYEWAADYAPEADTGAGFEVVSFPTFVKGGDLSEEPAY